MLMVSKMVHMLFALPGLRKEATEDVAKLSHDTISQTHQH